MANTFNVSSDDAAIASLNSSGDDMDDGEDPLTRNGQSRAGGKDFFIARRIQQTPLRQVLASGREPIVGGFQTTPGAHLLP